METKVDGPIRALIYARVSSERQKIEGNGLESQEHRCREFAKAHGCEVEAAFLDSASGGGDFMKRPQMVALLKYIDAHPFKQYVVIFDDLKRFARDMAFHIKLRAEFNARGVVLKCLNFNFENSPMGEFSEGVLMLAAQLERQQNRIQVFQKMKARLELGYWTFNSDIPGYRRNNKEDHNWILVRKEPEASIIKEAFEGYASGRFRILTDVVTFLREQRLYGDRKIYLGAVQRIFSRSLYAGYIEYEPWEVERRQGHHEPIISPDTFEVVQQKMSGRTFKRIVDRKEFPLKGLVLCSQCNRRFTAGWTTGGTAKKRKYPYYRCQGIYCKQKDVRKEKIEGDFEEFLRGIAPREEALALVECVVKDVWQMRLKEQDRVLSNQKRHHEALLREKDQVLAKIVKTENEAVSKALEARLEMIDAKVEETKLVLAKQPLNEENYGTALGMVINLLKNPIDIWQNGDYDEKRLVTRLVFSADPVYDRELGYGTADLSIGVRLFEQIGTQKLQDVDTWSKTLNRLKTYLSDFWVFYQSSPALQKALEAA